MKYSKNENDDLIIKAHLDASLDKKGISVSEELISRTLAAVKANSAEAESKGNAKKARSLPSWSRYIYGFAKAAAVVLIIAAGYIIFKNYPAKKDSSDLHMEMRSTESSTPEEKMEYDYAAGTAESTGSSAAESPDEEMNETFGLTPFAGGEGITEDEDAGLKGKLGLTMERNPKKVLSIHDVIYTDPEQIQSLTVMEGEPEGIVLTDKDAIKEFCDILAGYSYNFAGNDETDATDADGNEYVITVRKQDGTEYTISVGSMVIMEYMEDESPQRQVYEPEDISSLLADLQELYSKYN